MATEEQPAVFHAVDELQMHAVTPEDQATLAQWRHEAEADRAAALANLGQVSVELVAGPGGALVPKAEIVNAQENGQGIIANNHANRR